MGMVDVVLWARVPTVYHYRQWLAPNFLYLALCNHILVVLQEKLVKLLNCFMDTDPSSLFEIKQNTKRGLKLKQFKKRCNPRIRKAFFTQRIVNDWNNLRNEIVNCSTVQQLERAYDKLKHADKFTFT